MYYCYKIKKKYVDYFKNKEIQAKIKTTSKWTGPIKTDNTNQ
ncbi:hypothetical protein EUCA11A_34330 [Eubacterium callanderi]|nr:hypothetical protein EUCA2A_34330 [Eubacterium callanderi]WPK73543.1 hypothetical protein EUCA11A_34330 [Eubacterium callanderi]